MAYDNKNSNVYICIRAVGCAEHKNLTSRVKRAVVKYIRRIRPMVVALLQVGKKMQLVSGIA